MAKQAAVILDRDGVINLDSDSYVMSLQEFKLIPKSVQAIADLHQAGWPVDWQQDRLCSLYRRHK